MSEQTLEQDEFISITQGGSTHVRRASEWIALARRDLAGPAPVAQPVAWIQEQQGFFPGDGRRDLVWQRNTNADPAYWKYVPLYTEKMK